MENRWPQYNAEEIRAVSAILESGNVNYWTGPYGREFERVFSDAVGVQALVVSNGTVALELALEALGVGGGDEVIVTPRSFMASAASIVRRGAKPVFCDLDFETQNISVEELRSRITRATKCMIAVHLAGWPCDMEPLTQICKENNIKIIEDCAQAHGATYKRGVVGSFGDVSCWSFCQDKIISTGGEGGMIATKDEDLFNKIWALRDHGKNRAKLQMPVSNNLYKWVHDSFGGNFRMTEIQSALGLIQFQRLRHTLEARRRVGLAFLDSAKSRPDLFDIPKYACSCNKNQDTSDCCRHAFYRTYLYVRGDVSMRNEIIEVLNASGVECAQGACPELYREKAFSEKYPELGELDLPVAKKLGEVAIAFNSHPFVSEREIDGFNQCISRF